MPSRYLVSSESAVNTSDHLGRHLVHRDKPREIPTWEAEIVKGNIYISQLKFGARHAVILAEEVPQVLYWLPLNLNKLLVII